MGRGLSRDSKDLLRRIYAVFEAEHPMSPRRCAYALFGNRAGTMAAKVSQLCGRMLEAGDLPLEWYDDSSRSYVDAYVVEDVTGLIELKRGVPPFDPWKLQPVRVVVWSEKAVGGTLEPVLQALAVPFLNTSGWNSRKMLIEEARRTRRDPRRTIILYVGDYDAAGLRMSDDDLPTRFRRYKAAWHLELRRVAITKSDFQVIKRRRLTDPIKPNDPNRAWFVKHTGQHVGVELETVPAPELRRRVETAIRDCIEDVDAWNRVVAASQAVQESWEAYVDRWPRPQISIPGLDPGYGADRV